MFYVFIMLGAGFLAGLVNIIFPSHSTFLFGLIIGFIFLLISMLKVTKYTKKIKAYKKSLLHVDEFTQSLSSLYFFKRLALCTPLFCLGLIQVSSGWDMMQGGENNHSLMNWAAIWLAMNSIFCYPISHYSRFY